MFIQYLPKTFSQHSPSWRRYTFLSHLTTKSKISVRWIKKLVAATDGVYLILFFTSYNRVFTYTPGGECNHAATNSVTSHINITHLYVRIHIVIFIPYKIFTIYKFHPSLCVSQNVTAHAQSTSTTHFSCSSKCRRTSLYKSYHRVFDFVKSKSTG